jgi:hypothetical protein
MTATNSPSLFLSLHVNEGGTEWLFEQLKRNFARDRRREIVTSSFNYYQGETLKGECDSFLLALCFFFSIWFLSYLLIWFCVSVSYVQWIWCLQYIQTTYKGYNLYLALIYIMIYMYRTKSAHLCRYLCSWVHMGSKLCKGTAVKF